MDARAGPPELPRVELHAHVDGAARPATLLELARAGGVRLPADDVEALLPHVRAGPACRSLAQFLAVFERFYPVLAFPGAMRRVAFELVLDAAADGVVHLEARCCPALQADASGRDDASVLREVLGGLAAGALETGCSVGAIVCCYRSLPPSRNLALAELAVAHAGRGVVGLDLAGPEHLPGAPHAAAFDLARDAGLPVTVHAGEAAGPESVREALDVLHARRIGHGVAAARDPALVARLADEGVALECCLTSNLATGAVPDLARHPFDALRRAGVRVVLATDDPAVCDTTLSREFALAAATWGDGPAEALAVTRVAVDAAFVDPALRSALRARLDAAGTLPRAEAPRRRRRRRRP
jgi:adenosine deaminase